MTEVGDPFPAFSLQDEDGATFDSSVLEGVRYVIYFYPKDSSPGCTREAVEFTAALDRFSQAGIRVIGVSKDSVASHRRFIDSRQLGVKLLSDPDHVLMEKVGAWGPKVSYGKETVGTIRSTFLVGRDGRVEAVWRNVKVAGHVEKVLDRALSQPPVQRSQHIAGVRQQADVGEPVDRGVGVVVDRDDLPGSGHAGAVLHRAGDAERYVQVWMHGPSGHPHLTGAGHPALLHQGAGARDHPAHLPRD